MLQIFFVILCPIDKPSITRMTHLPKSLKEIGYRAFMGCSNLTIYYPYGTEARGTYKEE